MPHPPTSRYYGLPEISVRGRVGPALRLRDPEADLVGAIQHRLIEGERLDVLALRYYGREDLWWRIADANPARFPDDWAAGDVLLIPPLVRTTRL